VADPLVSLALAVAIPALSVLSAAAARRWTVKRWPEPPPVEVVAFRDELLAIVNRVQAESRERQDRHSERAAVAMGLSKDAFKSWKADQN
jgi:hypothetical protein